MSRKYQALFGETPEDEKRQKVAEATEAELKAVEEKAQAFEKHLKSCEKVSLAEAWSKLGVVDTELSKGGWPQLTIGTGDTVLVDAISGINALLFLVAGKYRVVDTHFHESWFDSRKPAEAVRSVFENGRWQLYDWKNGAFVYSRVRPDAKLRDGTPNWDRINHYRNQAAKHTAIDQVNLCKRFGTKLSLVLNFEKERMHYQTKVLDRLELTLPEVWEAVIDDWNESAAKRNIRFGNNSAQPDKGEAVLMVGEVNLTTIKTPVEIMVASNGDKPYAVYYDPAATFAKVILNNLRHSSPNTRIVEIREVVKA